MPDGEATFLVNPYSDPVLVKIQGRASFLNAPPVGEFFTHMMEQGRRRFLIDFDQCSGMDSTFLGILAGVGINLLKFDPPGEMTLSRLGPRNLDLVCNLGLDRLMEIDGEAVLEKSDAPTDALGRSDPSKSPREQAKVVLDAHENLVKADPANKAKFQDVIAFLRNEAEG